MAVIDLKVTGASLDPPWQVKATISAQNTWNNSDGIKLKVGTAYASVVGSISASTPTLQIKRPGTGEDWEAIYVFTSPFTTEYAFTVYNDQALYRLGSPTGGHTENYVARIAQGPTLP